MAPSLCCGPEAKTRSWSDSHILISCEERFGVGYLRVNQSAGSGLGEQPKVRRLLLFFSLSQEEFKSSQLPENQVRKHSKCGSNRVEVS